MRPRFPRGPRAVLRVLLPPHLSEPLIQEVEESFVGEALRRGRLRATLGAWKEAFSPSVLSLVRRERRQRRRGTRLGTVLREMRFATRSLGKSPGYAAGVISALALGIGLAVAVWTVVDAVLLADVSFAYRDGEVVSLQWSTEGRSYNAFSAADYLDVKRESNTFSDLHAYSSRSFTIHAAEGAHRIQGLTVSAGLLEMLGVTPAVGRFFRSEDDVNSSPRTVVISSAFWRRELGEREDIVGQVITINDEPHEVVGVTPDWFRFRAPGDGGNLVPSAQAQIFVPNAFPSWRFRVRQAFSYFLLGRLAGDASLGDASVEVRTIIAAVNHDAPVNVQTLKEHLVGYTRTPVLLVAGGVGLIFLLALVNAGNLVALRTVSRQRETAVRQALGSGYFRAVFTLSSEIVVLVVLSAIVAVLVALALLRVVEVGTYLPTMQNQHTLASASLGVSVLGGFASLVLMMVPFFRSSMTGRGGLRSTGPASRTRAEVRFQRSLVAGQIALAVMVLAGAITLSRSVAGMRSADLGIAVDRVSTYRLSLPEDYEDVEKSKVFLTSALDQVKSLPDVMAAGAVNFLPFRPHGSMTGPLSSEASTIENVYRKAITPGLLDALGMTLVAGRDFVEQDDATRPAVGLLSRSTAVGLFGSISAVDRVVRNANGSSIHIVGVVEDVRPERPDQPPVPTLYLPAYQDDFTDMSVVIKHAGSVAPFAAVRAITSGLDSRVPVFEEAGIRELIDLSIASERTIAALFSVFASVGLLIGVIGVYSTSAFAVANSRPEFGMRMALGATSASIRRRVLGSGLRMGSVGIALGLALYAVFSQMLSGFVFQVRALDGVSVGVAAVALASLSVLGSLIPAHRASVVDPMESLRAE